MTTDSYRYLEVQPVSGSLGAELSGVDLGNISDDVFEEIYRAFVAHQVVFFRDQILDEEAYIAFAKRWGDIMLYPYMEGLPGHPEILQVLKEPGDTYAFGNQWHTDSSFIAIPPKATMLYALELPPAGGDTGYASMFRAYDALSDGMKALLAPLRVLNVGNQKVPRFTELSGMQEKDPGEVQVRGYHPLIRTHPDSGRKALNVGAHSVGIEGLSEEESAPLLEYLYQHGARQEFTCRFRWSEGTVGIWDNRCVQHYAIDDYHGHRRRMHRLTIAGEEAPF
jgi:taurine dioxygenase